MGGSDIPKKLRRFIVRFVGSVEQIEVLLLLYRDAARSWSVEEISLQLRSSATSIETRLTLLQRQGFIARASDDERRFRFQPRLAEFAAVVGLLEAEYRARPVKVVEAVYAGPTDKMMSLVDTFDFRREDESD